MVPSSPVYCRVDTYEATKVVPIRSVPDEKASKIVTRQGNKRDFGQIGRSLQTSSGRKGNSTPKNKRKMRGGGGGGLAGGGTRLVGTSGREILAP